MIVNGAVYGAKKSDFAHLVMFLRQKSIFDLNSYFYRVLEINFYKSTACQINIVIWMSWTIYIKMIKALIVSGRLAKLHFGHKNNIYIWQTSDFRPGT
jgi:hypothetical protein